MRPSTTLLLLMLFSLKLFSKEVPDRLIKLNKYWQAVSNEAYSSTEIDDFSEEELIEFHLLAVIDSLKKVDVRKFNQDQLKNRNQLLDRLSGHARRQIFPKNTYHWERTPYFIDIYGTPCAVGYLIIESDNRALAAKVSREMNYAYLEDMPYSEIGEWAQVHGFTVDELKWIQPGYGPQCQPGQVIQPLCEQPSLLALGCFNPDWQADSLIPPLTYLTEYDDGSGWVVDSFNLWQSWGAQPGQYRISITDSNQRVMIYNYNITAPPPILSQDSVVQHSNSQSLCDGKLIVQPARGNAPYQIMLMNQQLNYISSNTSGIFDSLCPAIYTIIITDANFCQGQDSAKIELITGLNTYAFQEHIQFQNPLRDQSLSLNTSLKGLKTLTIYNLKGELIFQQRFSEQQLRSYLDIHNGLYILELSNEKERVRKKLIVHN
jgi:hypothetical protein